MYGEQEQLRWLLIAMLHNLRKPCCMSFDRLTDTAVPAMQLNSALNLERRRVVGEVPMRTSHFLSNVTL
jgi:hypothetical protein